MAQNGLNIYAAALESTAQQINNFFGRVRLLRTSRSMGRVQLINNMKAMGATITFHSLEKYENGTLGQVSQTYLNLFCQYFGVDICEMIKPLSAEERAQIEALKASSKQSMIGSLRRA